MGNNFIFTGDDGPKKPNEPNTKRHRGRRKSRKQIEEDIKKKWKEEEKKKQVNPAGRKLAATLIAFSIPIALFTYYLMIKIVPAILIASAVWIANIVSK